MCMFVQFCAYLSQSGAKAIQQLCSCPVRIKNMALKCIEYGRCIFLPLMIDERPESEH